MDSLRDVVSLTKPRLTSLVVVTTAGGLYLAHGSARSGRVWAALGATTLAVAAANTLNCFIERDLDRRMARTQGRPLPSGRMRPVTALAVGVALAVVSVAALLVAVNALTAALGALAIGSYVGLYTPLKTRSAAALMVGAIPGALPPLMGFTAVEGRVTTAGAALFAVLFLWQMPHFMAIAVYRRSEYAAAGMKVISLSRSARAIRWRCLAWTAALVPATLSLTPLGLAGTAYFACATALGAGLFGSALAGFRAEDPRPWAWRLFRASIVYLAGLFVALALDAR